MDDVSALDLIIEVADRPTNELVKLAADAKYRGVQLWFEGMERRSLIDVISLVGAGAGWAGLRVSRHRLSSSYYEL